MATAPNFLPFYDAPATNNLRDAIAKCIRQVQADFDVSDDELEERLLISHQTLRNVRNKQNTLGALAIARLAYFYGPNAIEPIMVLTRRAYTPEPETTAEKRRRLIRELAALEEDA
jgi:hypothetical protein